MTAKIGQTQNRVAGLDIIRTIAVLSVVCHHFSIYWWAREPVRTPMLLAGVVGVELFFVLSGFLIGGILFRKASGGDFSMEQARGFATDFWIRRWFRTLPNYVLFLLLFCLAALWQGQNLAGLWRYFFFLQNFSANHVDPCYGVSWSLCVEEWSYILLPLVYLVSRYLWKDHRRAALTCAVSLTVIPAIIQLLMTNLHSGDYWDRDIRKIVIYRISAIGIGVSLAWIKDFQPVLAAKLATRNAAVGALIVFALLCANFADVIHHHSFWTLSLRGLAGVWINTFWFITVDLTMLVFVLYFSRIQTVRSASWLRFFTQTSLLSYSIYLSHTLIQQNADFVRDHIILSYLQEHALQGTFGRLLMFVVDIRHPLSKALMVVVDLALTYLMSSIVFRFFELPMTNLREKFAVGRRPGRQSRQTSPDEDVAAIAELTRR